jgi:heavy metal efflux system protein
VRLDWTGEFESQQRANRRLSCHRADYAVAHVIHSVLGIQIVEMVVLILAVVALSPLGGFFSLLVTRTHFSVSSGLGFLALMGVSVEIGVIMVEYINQLRTRGMNPREAAKEGGAVTSAADHDNHAGRHPRTCAHRAIA